MPVHGHRYTHLSAATAAVADRFVASTNMKVGLYTLANSGLMPTGTVGAARKVTVTHTTVTGADTLGTIDVVGTDLSGAVISESIVPLAGTVATSTKLFAAVTSVTGVGWVINTGNDTITVGIAAGSFVAEGDGVLHIVVVNTTAAGAVTITDSAGTIAILKASIVEGHFEYDVAYADHLGVALAAASDVSILFD